MTSAHRSEVEALLRGLAAGDESSLCTVLAPRPELAPGAAWVAPALDCRIGALVRLAALLAVDACTTSLRWAVELAGSSGADDGAVVAVLLATGSAVGAAQLVTNAPRLALALDVDVESTVDGHSAERRPGT